MKNHGCRLLCLASLMAAAALQTGCTLMNATFPWLARKEQWEPEEVEDKWSFVGREGRGNRALEDEHDPLKPFLMSPQAQAIERNMGYK